MNQQHENASKYVREDDGTIAISASTSALITLCAGGFAGAVSRTCVAPLERTKILFQVQATSARGKPPRYTSVWQSLVDIGRREGVRGFFRGNAVNCMRIVPMSAIQFATYEELKRRIGKGKHTLAPEERLGAGALAGACAQAVTHPLDVMRARVTADLRGVEAGRGLIGGLRHVWRTEGFVACYRGLVPSLIGIMPYVGVDFMVFEELKALFLRRGIATDPRTGELTVRAKLCAGAVAGVCGQTIAFPLDTVRRNLQVQSIKTPPGEPLPYRGMLHCFRVIVRRDGFLALYSGLWPNFLKAVPSVSISFFVFEEARDALEEMYRRR